MNTGATPGERTACGFQSGLLVAGLTVLLGLLLWKTQIGHGLVHWSYGLPVIVGPKQIPEEVVIVKMDEQSFIELGQTWPDWSREVHARFLKRLTADQARLVVFDIYFAQSEPKPEDAELAAAIRENGRVVLAGVNSPMAGFKGFTTHPPLDTLRQAAGQQWGISLVELDTDPAVRRHYPGTDEFPSLPWAAAAALEAEVTRRPEARFIERWLRYYDADCTLPSLSYYQALQQPPGYFKDRIVFIGGEPISRHVREELDAFRTPYTHLGGPRMAGVEVQATTFLNLLRGDWLSRMPAAAQVCVMIGCGILFGFGLSRWRHLLATGWAALGIACVTGVAWWLFWKQQVWFPWLIVATGQIPFALLCSVILHWALRLWHRSPGDGRSPAPATLALARPTPVAAVSMPSRAGTLPQWFPEI